MGRYTLLSIASCLVLLLAPQSHAGNNALGKAWLSWDEAGSMIDRSNVPAQPVSIFVHLQSAPDVQALAVNLRWFPFDSLSGCYRCVSSSPDTGCGWTTALPPGDGFDGDTTYTWSTMFPPLSTARNCVFFSISGAGCDGPTAADFVLASVKVKDSTGQIDSLLVIGSATILGGSEMRATVAGVLPRVVPPRRSTAVTISGRNFAHAARVELRGRDTRYIASSVTTVSDSELVANINLSAAPADSLALIVQLPDGRTGQLANAIQMDNAAPSASAPSSTLRPTNDAGAFRKFDLYADRTFAANVSDHFNSWYYPAWLNTDSLLVTRLSPGDTMALFNSKPYDAVDLSASNPAFQSVVEYAVQPPQYATSLGLLTFGYLLFNGAGTFADYGKPFIGVTMRYANGGTTYSELRVGKQARNFFPGSADCGGVSEPLYSVPPDDTLAAVVFSGLGGGGNDIFYDAQEIPLPPGQRSQKVIGVRLANVKPSIPCQGSEFPAQAFLNGLTLWPSFEVRNRQGGGLGLQQQFAGGWQDQVFGGFVLRDTLFGAFDTFRQKACILSCMAMVSSYFGDSVKVDELNDYLVRNKGYQRVPVVRITSLSGQDPGATLTYKDMGGSTQHPMTSVGDTLLFEARDADAWTAPLVTAIVGPSHGQATVLRRHQRGVLSIDEEGYGYGDLNPREVANGWSQGRWRLVDLGTSPTTTPVKAESTLVDSLPVLLDVRGSPKHYVLARGWKPTVGATSAHGTYVINDPGHSGVSRLSDGRFNNTFAKARRCERTNPAGGYVASALGGGITLVVSGGAHANITSPGGQSLYYDASADAYAGDLADANAWPAYDSILDDDPDAATPASDYIELPVAANGDYRVIVVAPEAGSYALAVRADGSGGGRRPRPSVDSTSRPRARSRSTCTSKAARRQSRELTHWGRPRWLPVRADRTSSWCGPTLHVESWRSNSAFRLRVR